MKIRYTLVRPDLEEFMAAECDSYKAEVHPITGKFTLTLYTLHGAATNASEMISGVVYFSIKRP